MRSAANTDCRATAFLFAALLFIGNPVAAEPFHSDRGHYTVDLPAHWKAIPPQQATLLGLHVTVVLGGPLTVDAGFQTADANGAAAVIACIVIEPYPGGHAPPIVFTNETKPELLQPPPGQNADGITFETKAHTFHARQTVAIFAGLTLQTESHGWFGTTALVTFTTAAAGPVAEKYAPDFAHIAASFRFDRGYAPEQPGLLFPSLALAVIAATVTWVARRAHASLRNGV